MPHSIVLRNRFRILGGCCTKAISCVVLSEFGFSHVREYAPSTWKGLGALRHLAPHPQCLFEYLGSLTSTLHIILCAKSQHN